MPGLHALVQPAGNLIEVAADAPDGQHQCRIDTRNGLASARFGETSRRSVEAGRPAASALARSRAFSDAVQRKTKVSVSGSLAGALPAPVGFEGEACRPSQDPVSAAPAYDMGRLAVCAWVGLVALMI